MVPQERGEHTAQGRAKSAPGEEDLKAGIQKTGIGTNGNAKACNQAKSLCGSKLQKRMEDPRLRLEELDKVVKNLMSFVIHRNRFN